MNKIHLMHLAEREQHCSPSDDRQVGAVLYHPDWPVPVLAHNEIAQDSSNGHHAEFILIRRALENKRECTPVGEFQAPKPYPFRPRDLSGATLFVTCRPCVRCCQILRGLGLAAVFYRDAQPEMNHLSFLSDAGVALDGRWIQGAVIDRYYNDREGRA